jgi:RND family efflux transporter MFP subunit
MRLLTIGRAVRALASASAAFILAIAMAGCRSSADSRPQNTPAVQGLHVETLRLQTIPDEIEAPGSVIAVSTAQVAARTMGTVTEVAVREGDFVKRGQLLAQFDARELLARRNAAREGWQEAEAGVVEATRAVAAAQAQADVAKKTYDRYVYLRDQKSISPQEFDEVEARQRSAEAGLDQARARLRQAQAGNARAESEARAAEEVAGYARVVSPFDGRVIRRTVEPGSLISPGMPLFVVEDNSRYQLEVTLPTGAVATAAGASSPVRRGSVARVEVDALPGKTFSGKVMEVEAGADPSSHTLQARIDLPHDVAIQSGLFGRAWFRRGERRALVVLGSAILERGQLSGVYVADANGVAHWRIITTGQRIGDRTEILSGLSEGDRVVVNPGIQELDDLKVPAPASGAGEKSR